MTEIDPYFDNLTRCSLIGFLNHKCPMNKAQAHSLYKGTLSAIAADVNAESERRETARICLEAFEEKTEPDGVGAKLLDEYNGSHRNIILKKGYSLRKRKSVDYSEGSQSCESGSVSSEHDDNEDGDYAESEHDDNEDGDYGKKEDGASNEEQKLSGKNMENDMENDMEDDMENGMKDEEAVNRKRKHEGDEGDKGIMDILDNMIKCSETARMICAAHTKYHPNDDVIDLRSKSPFLMQLPSQLVTSYLSEIDEAAEALIPENVHEFLITFFSQELAGLDWQNKIDDLQSPDKNDIVMVGTIRILRRTLPQFIKAFSLGAFNPLLNITTIEKPHLNAFVHPCLEAALWHIAQVHYEFGEIPSRNHINRDCADGVGFMTSTDKFQLVYVEGSRPAAKDAKEATDAKKIVKNLRNIFAGIVKEIINNRRRVPSKMAVFGGQSFRLQLHLHYLDYCGKYQLNEVDNANVPRDFSEMSDFVWYYECILKWALLVRNVTLSFKEARTQKRPSRLSYANSLRLVKDM
ncbi:hypothetical protein BC938DRAFT_477616 [Jimgerdemannia flammicorona]|uniref:Uncharacterized protein n=1 Tax=Jimgerdemannia flammicorona TaxID=994334 RepID=A0A433QP52_9FUNG|nr:hypothetical protein BC938DRAFT_477616 [Jimgerdemannia flammicorona]